MAYRKQVGEATWLMNVYVLMRTGMGSHSLQLFQFYLNHGSPSSGDFLEWCRTEVEQILTCLVKFVCRTDVPHVHYRGPAQIEL